GNIELELTKEVFRQLILQFPRFKCTVYGGGSWSKYRWKEVKNFDVSNNIRVNTLSTGTIDELKE
ncbi:25814_t:CDS:1, partial [Dentiscutata erythropus]